MADPVQCPNCGQAVIPTETRVITRKRNISLKHLGKLVLIEVVALLTVTAGLFIFKYFGWSSIGLGGIAVSSLGILGLLTFTNPLVRSIQGQKIEQRRQECPLCRYHWIRQVDDSIGLQAYFTNVEDLRALFKVLLAAPSLSKRLLIIHGVGGVGKSSLLRMFRLHCRSVNAPVALVSGDEAKTEIDVLSTWAKQLNAVDINLPTFTQTLDQYYAIQLKVEQHAQGKASDSRGKTVTHALVQTATNAVPIVGVPLSVFAGAGVETLMDWRHSFLSQSQIELQQHPIDRLTECFLADLAQAAERKQPSQRIVLLLDTLEQMRAFDNWICHFAQRLYPRVLLVIAGRAVPKWDQLWDGWLAQATVEELKQMDEKTMRDLVRSYYGTQRGGEPDPTQVEAIIRFARGLPLAVTTAVRLWVLYGVEDFQAVKPQVVADLANQLTKEVSEPMRSVLNAAATLRWFNKEILRVVIGEAASDPIYDVIYNELRWFPFMRSRAEGLVMQNLVREILDDNLHEDEPERHREMHQRAADYFAKRRETAKGDEATRLALEQLYHSVRADEEQGIELFEIMAEELFRYRLLNPLRAMLTDMNNYSLRQKNSQLWLNYYNARLADQEGRTEDAEKIYKEIGENKGAEAKLRAYALCDWGYLLQGILAIKPFDAEKCRQLIMQGLALYPLDSKLVIALTKLSEAYYSLEKWDDSLASLEKAKKFCLEHNDYYGVAYICNHQKYHYMGRGDWTHGLSAQKEGLEALARVSEDYYPKAELLGGYGIAWVWAGQYAEGERNLRGALEAARQVGVVGPISAFCRDLGALLTAQDKFAEADLFFRENQEILQNLPEGSTGLGIGYSFWGHSFLKRGELSKAQEYLERGRSILGDQDKWNSFYHLIPLGELYELRHEWSRAESHYEQCLNLRWAGRHYFVSAAFIGLMRVKFAQHQYNEIPPLLSEAEQLAQLCNFNDCLASLRIIQGHMVWDGFIPESGEGFDVALHFYKQVLVYALRYNRFLLDTLLSGRPHDSLMCSIIPACQDHEKEGRRMLKALRDWWQINVNDIDTSHSDDILTIPNGISLLEAEREARKHESGDGSPQRTVTEQLDQALAGFHE